MFEVLRRSARYGVLGAIGFALSLTSATAQEWRVETHKLPFPVAEIVQQRDKIFVRDHNQDWQRLVISDAGLGLAAGRPVWASLPTGVASEKVLPDGIVATGSGSISRSWLEEPVTRYAHGVLGDAIEAGTLTVEVAGNKLASFRLDQSSVFEDISPRIVTLGKPAKPYVVTIRSYLNAGGSLAIFGIKENALQPIAQTPPIGQTNRWLNPAGTADFDGDGQNEVAIVVTPHIGGKLQLWRLERSKLVKTSEVRGFSNHVIGSRILALSAVSDFNGDGIADLALPSARRDQLRIVSWGSGKANSVSIKLPARINGGVAALETSIFAGLESGEIAVISQAN